MFYKVWVRSLGYRGHEPLTYSYGQKLRPGTVVLAPLQKELVLGFISSVVAKPSFATKPLALVYNLPPLPPELPKLAAWLQAFYATNLGTAAQQILPAQLSAKTIRELTLVVASTIKAPSTSLTEEQTAVVKSITKPDTYLLHGKTGSGKTRVYVELALAALTEAKSALILTPEIGLTSQLTQTFRAVFGEQVILLHSQLTGLQRQKAWLQILTATEPLVVIGPRSALFSPLKNIGLIVIDEAHETAYKQEQAPYYHALRVASQLAQLHAATLVIGSATPSVTDYYMAEQRQKPILAMNSLATVNDHLVSEVQVVDLKDRSQFSRSQNLSTALLKAIQDALGRQEQSLVYLNRRGTARVILCENCGWQALCPHCDLPLVYHGDSSRLRCHTCGFSQAIVTSCPACGHPSVLFKSFGTKAIFDELQRLFPEARIQRFDTDNTKSERFEQHYDAVKRGEVDILVGTQLLAKGLDLPNLSTLGIVLADSSLYLPDFSATERTYQLLTQVLGRVGRGHRQGHVIVQTYHTDSPILQAAIASDWDTFYQTELTERQKFHFPPFAHLLKLSCRRASAKSAELASQKLKEELLKKIINITVDGPAPSFHEKLQGKYQYQLVVKSTNRSKLIDVIHLLPNGWTYDIDPVNLL